MRECREHLSGACTHRCTLPGAIGILRGNGEGVCVLERWKAGGAELSGGHTHEMVTSSGQQAEAQAQPTQK